MGRVLEAVGAGRVVRGGGEEAVLEEVSAELFGRIQLQLIKAALSCGSTEVRGIVHCVCVTSRCIVCVSQAAVLCVCHKPLYCVCVCVCVCHKPLYCVCVTSRCIVCVCVCVCHKPLYCVCVSCDALLYCVEWMLC